MRESAVKKSGPRYFPSLGVLPNRIFPFVVTQASRLLAGAVRTSIALKDVLARIEALRGRQHHDRRLQAGARPESVALSSAAMRDCVRELSA